MTFNLSGVCSLPESFCHKIRNSKTFTLILIKASGDISVVVDGRADKDALMAQHDPAAGDVILMAWTGEYSSSIFRLTDEDLKNHYR